MEAIRLSYWNLMTMKERQFRERTGRLQGYAEWSYGRAAMAAWQKQSVNRLLFHGQFTACMQMQGQKMKGEFDTRSTYDAEISARKTFMTELIG